MTGKNFLERNFWRRLPATSYIVFLLGVFSLFAAIGFIIDIWSGATLSLPMLSLNIIYSGLVAAGYAFVFTKDMRWFPLVIIFQVGFHFIPWSQYFAVQASHADIQARLNYDAFGILFLIVLAYVLFNVFIAREGFKQAELRREMELAAEIHNIIVPPIATADINAVVAARSLPADDVGGDLVDYFSFANNYYYFLADVSGHGVAPGVLMAMFKASLRATARHNTSLATILRNIHELLIPLKKRNMFITVAGVHINETEIEYITAGHLLILHFATNALVTPLHIAQLPLGSPLTSEFTSAALSYRSGDKLILLSDGISEQRDKVGNEMGMDAVIALLQQTQVTDLNKWLATFFARLEERGKRADDQSLMLIHLT
jgi:serine phosphatase RsbU (regulator of sigma subunit)